MAQKTRIRRGAATPADARRLRRRNERFLLLWDAFDTVNASLGSSVSRYLHLDPAILEEVVTNYYEDLGITKHYHGITFADCHKRAAFTLKWIVRLRPVQIARHGRGGALPLEAYLVNEIFALKASTAFLEGYDISQETPEFMAAFFSLCRRRELDGEVLSSLMYALDRQTAKLSANS